MENDAEQKSMHPYGKSANGTPQFFLDVKN